MACWHVGSVWLPLTACSCSTEGCACVSFATLAWWRPYGSGERATPFATPSQSLWSATASWCPASSRHTCRSAASPPSPDHYNLTTLMLISFLVMIINCISLLDFIAWHYIIIIAILLSLMYYYHYHDHSHCISLLMILINCISLLHMRHHYLCNVVIVIISW